MGSTQFGNFLTFCHATTLPVCNLFSQSEYRPENGYHNTFGRCELLGISLSNDRYLRNLGTILVCAIAIVMSFILIARSERKKAAVGRREIQLFLAGFIVIEICEIFTVGGIPFQDFKVVAGFTGVHLAAIAATSWILLLNGIVGFQLLDDGTALSMGMILGSAAAIFIGTGYIALDTGLQWTGYFNSSLTADTNNRNIGLYVLYQLFPLVCIVVFFVVEAILVLRVLGERKPMFYLLAAAVLFALGQVFQYTVSPFICTGTGGKINGTFFETLFTFLSVATIWIFWSSITEDDWPMPTTGGTYT